MNERISFLDKELILIDAVRATIEKLGRNQAIQALVAAITMNDFRYFTNGNEYTINFRDVLCINFNKDDVYYIVSKLSKTDEIIENEYNEVLDMCAKFVVKDMKRYNISNENFINEEDYYLDDDEELDNNFSKKMKIIINRMVLKTDQFFKNKQR